MCTSEKASFRFQAREHLRRPADFRKVYDRRRSASDACLLVYACSSGLPYSRLGLSVSRRFGNATCRNRWRRLCREAFRLTRHELPKGLDLILIPQSGHDVTLDQLKDSLRRLVQKIDRKLTRQGRPE
jgi:ribonuclease P protein component